MVALVALFLGRFLAPVEGHAQVLEVGGSLGLSYYMGDINPHIPFNQSKFGFGAIARYYEGTRWAFRLAYSYLPLAGSDEKSGYRPERGLSFKTNVHDVALTAEFNFFDYFTGSRRSRISPYIFGGISMLYFNPKAEDGTELHSILTDVDDYTVGEDDNGNEKITCSKYDYSKTVISIPFGVGVKYSVNTRIGTSLEWRWHWTLTDWLDDCHAYYPTYKYGDDYAQYADPTGFAAGANGQNSNMYIQRGNQADNDWFGYLNLTITYKFNLPNGKDCNKKERYNNYK